MGPGEDHTRLMRAWLAMLATATLMLKDFSGRVQANDAAREALMCYLVLGGPGWTGTRRPARRLLASPRLCHTH